MTELMLRGSALFNEKKGAAEKTGAPFFVRLQQPESNPPTWPRGTRG